MITTASALISGFTPKRARPASSVTSVPLETIVNTVVL